MIKSLRFKLLPNKAKSLKIDELAIIYNEERAKLIYRHIIDSINGNYSGGKYTDVKEVSTKMSKRWYQICYKDSIEAFKAWDRRSTITNLKINSITTLADKKTLQLEESRNSKFDYWIKLSTLERGNPIYIPFNSYEYANEFFDKYDIMNAYRLVKVDGIWYIDLMFKKEAEPKGTVPIGVDMGMNKLIADSKGNRYGTEYYDKVKYFDEKIQRKKPGSRRRKKLESDLKSMSKNECGKAVNELRSNLGLGEFIVYESLNISKFEFSRRMNRLLSGWVSGYLKNQIKNTMNWGNIKTKPVNPAYTSQLCSNCGIVDEDNRHGEIYWCWFCGHIDDADHNASINIKRRSLDKELDGLGKNEIKSVLYSRTAEIGAV